MLHERALNPQKDISMKERLGTKVSTSLRVFAEELLRLCPVPLNLLCITHSL